MSSDTEFFNVDSNDLSDMVDDESDDNHGGTFDFTVTDATIEAMKNVNDKYCRMLDIPPYDYCALSSNDVSFLLDIADTDEKLSWDKVLLFGEALPTDLDASKCDDFKDPRGYYELLGCGKISSDTQIKNALLLDKATFRRISLANHPDKSSNPKDPDKFKVANNKCDMAKAAYNVLGVSDDFRDFHLRCE